MKNRNFEGLWTILTAIFVMPLTWIILETITGAMYAHARGFFFADMWYYDYEAVLAFISAMFITRWWKILLCIAGIVISFKKVIKIEMEKEKMSDEEYINSTIREIANMDETNF